MTSTIIEIDPVSEYLEIGKTQFNHGIRGLNIEARTVASLGVVRATDQDAIYAIVTLTAEVSNWGGQRDSKIEIFVRPSKAIRIHFTLPPFPCISTYSSDVELKSNQMRAGLDHLSAQAIDWVNRYVFPRSPSDR